MKIRILLLSFLISTLGMAQNGFIDIKVPKGQFSFKPITHGSLVMKINGRVFCVDPYGGAAKYDGLNAIDFVVITDIHPDHLDISTLEGLDLRASKFIVPRAVFEKLPANWQKNAFVLANGEHRKIGETDIEAIPMYNLTEDRQKFHTKGRGNGYVFDIDGFKIYISGDTEDTPEMRDLEDIDIAFVCMNLPYTMSVDQAVDAVAEFMPVVVYPYHYRNGDKSYADVKEFARRVEEEGVQAEILEWY